MWLILQIIKDSVIAGFLVLSRTGKMEIFMLLSAQNNDITSIFYWHVNLSVSCKNCKIEEFHCKCQLFLSYFTIELFIALCGRSSSFPENGNRVPVNFCYFQTPMWKEILNKSDFRFSGFLDLQTRVACGSLLKIFKLLKSFSKT